MLQYIETADILKRWQKVGGRYCGLESPYSWWLRAFYIDAVAIFFESLSAERKMPQHRQASTTACYLIKWQCVWHNKHALIPFHAFRNCTFAQQTVITWGGDLFSVKLFFKKNQFCAGWWTGTERDLLHESHEACSVLQSKVNWFSWSMAKEKNGHVTQ